MRIAQASGMRKAAPWRCRVCTVAPDAGDAAAWGARLLEHAAVAWGGREGRVQRLAEVLAAPEAHLPSVIALRDALAAGRHCSLSCTWCGQQYIRLMLKPLGHVISNCNNCCTRQGHHRFCYGLASPRTDDAAHLV
jgi:hypothetical protein